MSATFSAEFLLLLSTLNSLSAKNFKNIFELVGSTQLEQTLAERLKKSTNTETNLQFHRKNVKNKNEKSAKMMHKRGVNSAVYYFFL